MHVLTAAVQLRRNTISIVSILSGVLQLFPRLGCWKHAPLFSGFPPIVYPLNSRDALFRCAVESRCATTRMENNGRRESETTTAAFYLFLRESFPQDERLGFSTEGDKFG